MGIMELIARAPWREAVTYRDTWPHEYVVIQKDGQQELLAAFHHRISRGEGVECRFFHRTQKYLFLGEYKYWALQDGDEIILNRALLYKDRRDFVIREGDTGTAKAIEVVENEEVTEEVDVRELWPREDRDFTPWLAKNLDILGDEIGLKLEFISMEEPIGPFSLDILARDVNSGGLVAIENQLEWTDHTHLGQLLTYAAGCGTRLAVWITPWLRNEHGEALNQLNRWTNGSIKFYGVEVEAIQTGKSLPKPKFRLKASPSEEYVKNHDAADISPRASRLRDFSQELRQNLWRTKFFDGIPVRRNYYYGVGIQEFASISGEDVCYRASLEGSNDAWVSLYVGATGDERTERIFSALKKESEQIQAILGATRNAVLQWMQDDGTNRSGVHIRRDGSIDDPPEKLEETKAWMIENLIKFKAVFEPRLEKILSENPR